MAMLLDIPINFNFLCMTQILMMIMRTMSLKRFNISTIIFLTISLELKCKNVIRDSFRYKYLYVNDSLFMNYKFFFIFPINF